MSVEKGTTAAEITTQRSALTHAIRRLDAIAIVCGSCQHFEMGTCALHGDVPVTFQKTVGACDDWRYDGVPF
jgi:hypothetical protein